MEIPHFNDLCFLFLEFLGAAAHTVLTELVIRNLSAVVWLRLKAQLHIFLKHFYLFKSIIKVFQNFLSPK